MAQVLSKFIISKPSRFSGYYLLYSSVTGNMVRCSDGEYRILNEDPSKLDPATISSLTDLGIVVDADVDETARLMANFNARAEPSRSLALTIVPTSQCNFKCTYCYEDSSSTSVMQDSTVSQLIDMIESRIPNLERLHITWFGGEPLLAVDIVLRVAGRIAQVASEHDTWFTQAMVSNAYLLTANVRKELIANGIRQIQITIDGDAAIHDTRRKLKECGGKTFDTVYRNTVAAMNDLEMTIQLRINIDEVLMKNSHHITNLLNRFSTDVDDTSRLKVSFGLLENYVSGAPDTEELTYSNRARFGKFRFKYYREHALEFPFLGRIGAISSGSGGRCGASTPNSLLIDSDGTIKSCWNHVGVEERVLGSLERPDDVRNPWVKLDPTESEACRKCKFLPQCMGGCPDNFYRFMKSAGKGDCTTLKGYIGEIMDYIDNQQ